MSVDTSTKCAKDATRCNKLKSVMILHRSYTIYQVYSIKSSQQHCPTLIYNFKMAKLRCHTHTNNSLKVILNEFVADSGWEYFQIHKSNQPNLMSPTSVAFKHVKPIPTKSGVPQVLPNCLRSSAACIPI